MKKHQISTKFNGKMSFIAAIDEHRFKIDAGIDDGGDGDAPGPKKLMLASLAGCTGIDIVSILNKSKAEYSDFTIDIEASVTETHPQIYQDIKIVYSIKMAEEDQFKMQRAVQLSEDKYCGVMAMFKSFARVETEIRF